MKPRFFSTSVDFEEFWREYPRKVGRVKAMQCWHKMSWDERDKAKTGLKLWKQSVDWLDPLYIPHASTFLHQRRWEDEPIVYAKVSDDRTPRQSSEQMQREIAEILRKHPDLA